MTEDMISRAIADAIYLVKAKNENKHNSTSFELQQAFSYLMTAQVWYESYVNTMNKVKQHGKQN